MHHMIQESGIQGFGESGIHGSRGFRDFRIPKTRQSMQKTPPKLCEQMDKSVNEISLTVSRWRYPKTYQTNRRNYVEIHKNVNEIPLVCKQRRILNTRDALIV